MADTPIDETLTWEDMKTRHGSQVATIAHLALVVETLGKIIGEKFKAQRADVKALETHAAAADDRVADLTKQLADLRVELDALMQVRS